MMKSIITGITALSLTLATVTPAQADGLDREDVGKLLLGLVAIAAVGAVIDNNQRRDQQSTQGRQNNQDRGSWADLNRPRERRAERARILPHRCLQTVETRFGHLRLFSERCLERRYRHVDHLPRRCEVRVYSAEGPRNGFDPLCLREQGYRTNRRQ